jgi:nicotinamide phosphoribosyltransferase
MLNKINNIIDTDSYKASHWLQYPPGVKGVFSYIESRGGKFPATVFFGLQLFLKEHLNTRVTMANVFEAEEFFKAHGEPFNAVGWKYIVEKHHGYIPVRIRAIPEGSLVPNHNVLVTVESTDPEVAWVTNWIETQLMRIWSPINTATLSYNIKKLILTYLTKTSDDPMSEINFKLHDFGSRGVSSRESAAINGAAHLVNFKGSDTCVGVWAAHTYYDEPMAAFSIPAAEHSTITAWGKEHEVDAYRNMLKQFAKPGSIVACVSDSFDLFNAIDTMWGDELKQQVIDSGATLVVRPDSGDPAGIVTQALQHLDAKFGHKINGKGFKVLNCVRVIQGDGINLDSINSILNTATMAGYSATNVTFGMGGALLQQHNRDTQKFAMKCSAVKINGEWRPVFKDPITDPGKRSKAGRLDLVRIAGNHGSSYSTVSLTDYEIAKFNTELHIVYEDGLLYNTTTLKEIRERINHTLR